MLISSFSIAQNQSNLIDTTGNIGIGTLSPSDKLTVNGSMRIDSSLTARDTAVFEKKIRVKGDVIIHGKTFMRDNGIANQNFRVQNGFRVDGISQFYNNVSVDSTFRVEGLGLFNHNVRVNGQFRTYGINNLFGTSRFHDEVRLINLTDPLGQNNEGMMMLTGNGKVIRKEIEETDTLISGYKFMISDANGNFKAFEMTPKMMAILRPEPLSCSFSYIATWNHDVGKTWIGKKPGLNCAVKVGINTSTPLYDLDVNGITRTKKLIIESTSTSNLIEVVNNNEKLLTLHHSGYLYTREIRVRPPSQFPDYVFAKDYPLMPLNELKTFIADNQHLPNIPSAKEVEEEGTVDLGEMNTKLLEKVEELTLYILQQEERIQRLEKKLENNNGGE